MQMGRRQEGDPGPGLSCSAVGSALLPAPWLGKAPCSAAVESSHRRAWGCGVSDAVVWALCAQPLKQALVC